MSSHFPPRTDKTLSLKGRGGTSPPDWSEGLHRTAAKRQGEGTAIRGVNPKLLLQRARQMRKERTEAEGKLWQRIRAGRLNELKFRNQVAFSANYIADFVCPKAKLIVELDGSQHALQVSYDAKRTQFFEQQGYRVLRFWNGDVYTNMHGVLETILAAATQRPLPARGASCPSPLQGEGI